VRPDQVECGDAGIDGEDDSADHSLILRSSGFGSNDMSQMIPAKVGPETGSSASPPTARLIQENR
jgi:hypothetical protein